MENRLDEISAAWDREYSNGRYLDEPPVPFVHDIIVAAEEAGLLGGTGLYIGAGNGRNYLPLLAAGLDLTGLDISGVAIGALAERMPGRTDRLVHGDLSCLQPGTTFHTVVGIQVFQHGSREFCHAHVRAALRRVAPGGMFALRVNAVGTDIEFRHTIVEPEDGSGFTVRYLEGPKEGLLVHFFDSDELVALLDADFEPILPLRRDSTRRQLPAEGSWSQWEGIWRHRRSAAGLSEPRAPSED